MINDLIDVVILFNLVLCIIIIVWDIYFYYKVPETERWTKILYTSVGAFWFIRYVLYFLDVPPFGPEHNIPVLTSLVTFTLLSLAVASIIRVQRIISLEDMKDDLIEWLRGCRKWKSKK